MSQLVSPEERREVGRRLVRIRKEAGLSQAAMAAALDVAPRTYQSYEVGAREVPGALYPRLRRLFNVDPAWLMEGETAGPIRRQNVLDDEIWTRAYIAVEEAISQAKAEIPALKKLKITRSVYEELLDSGRLHPDKLASLIELAA